MVLENESNAALAKSTNNQTRPVNIDSQLSRWTILYAFHIHMILLLIQRIPKLNMSFFQFYSLKSNSLELLILIWVLIPNNLRNLTQNFLLLSYWLVFVTFSSTNLEYILLFAKTLFCLFFTTCLTASANKYFTFSSCHCYQLYLTAITCITSNTAKLLTSFQTSRNQYRPIPLRCSVLSL